MAKNPYLRVLMLLAALVLIGGMFTFGTGLGFVGTAIAAEEGSSDDCDEDDADEDCDEAEAADEADDDADDGSEAAADSEDADEDSDDGDNDSEDADEDSDVEGDDDDADDDSSDDSTDVDDDTEDVDDSEDTGVAPAPAGQVGAATTVLGTQLTRADVGGLAATGTDLFPLLASGSISLMLGGALRRVSRKRK